MKLYCKCGHCLTNDLRKVSYKEAYYKIVESVEKVYGEDGVSEMEFDNSQWGVKAGTYHKWKRKSWLGKGKNVYVVNPGDLVGATLYDKARGCCRSDHFEVKCNACEENLGYGADDCWTDTNAVLYCTGVKVCYPKC